MTIQQITLPIDGMTCNGCAAGLQKALLRQTGVQKADVSFVDSAAHIEFDAEIVDLTKLTEVVDNAGFSVAAK